MSIDNKLLEAFQGKIVRKDLVNKIKGGLNVPVYVLEYLLGMYCNHTDEESIEEGINKVKKILRENYVRPDEAELIKSKIRELNVYTVIDKVTVALNEKKDRYELQLANLGAKNICLQDTYVKQYEKLLSGGIWCILTLYYDYDEFATDMSPFKVQKLSPIQIATLDMNDVTTGRAQVEKEQWIDFILASTGMNPEDFQYEEKWHLLTRMAPLIENNYNLCELGPRGTGKSHIYKEISPNSILISGGQTTVANLFYNMARKQVGLVGFWDVVAFDEIAGIKFKDKDGIQIMKDYMASGSFARGKDQINANASMVFIGNINQSVESLVKSSHLLVDFPPEMNNDSAFFDRMHAYVPGWEIPKLRPSSFTQGFGFIVDYMAEFFRELRKISYGNAFDKYFSLGGDLNQRDTIAVRKTVSALVKLVYPDGNYTKEEIQEILEKALVYRRRVKEQLKKMAGMEFFATHFSYIDKESGEEIFPRVKEQGGDKLIPEGQLKPGSLYTITKSPKGVNALYKIEAQVMAGKGKFAVADNKYKKTIENASNYLKINSKKVLGSINLQEKDFLISVVDEQNAGIPENVTLGVFLSMCTATLDRHSQSQTVIIGDMTLAGNVSPTEELASLFQVAKDVGAKRALIAMSNVAFLPQVPQELLAEVQPVFYTDPISALHLVLGYN